MMMIQTNSIQPYQFPATEALPSISENREGAIFCEATRTTKLTSINYAAVANVHKRPHGFDMSNVYTAMERIERETIDFPLLQWPSEDDLDSSFHHHEDDSDRRYYNKRMGEPMEDPMSKRHCRGLLRSLSSADLSEMVSNLENGSM